MRAGIYARYSSESQRQESIEDQIFTCRRLAREKGFTVLDDHIYTDYAQSGASKDRVGLNEMITASAGKLFDVILVDDLVQARSGQLPDVVCPGRIPIRRCQRGIRC